jgi:hypothetical protein
MSKCVFRFKHYLFILIHSRDIPTGMVNVLGTRLGTRDFELMTIKSSHWISKQTNPRVFMVPSYRGTQVSPEHLARCDDTHLNESSMLFWVRSNTSGPNREYRDQDFFSPWGRDLVIG